MYIVIMGGGKVGNYLADVLLRQHHEVAVLEANRAQADRLSMELQGQYLIINGDGCDSDFQEDAGIRNADVFVAVATTITWLRARSRRVCSTCRVASRA